MLCHIKIKNPSYYLKIGQKQKFICIYIYIYICTSKYHHLHNDWQFSAHVQAVCGCDKLFS